MNEDSMCAETDRQTHTHTPTRRHRRVRARRFESPRARVTPSHTRLEQGRLSSRSGKLPLAAAVGAAWKAQGRFQEALRRV